MGADWYLWALAFAAIAVAAIAWNVPRAALWVGLQALSFCFSGWAHDAELPYAAALGAFSDLVIICALYAYCQLLYEIVFWLCFILMQLIDLMFLTHLLNSHFVLAVGLEAANWLALISIGAAGMADRAGIGRYWVGVLRARPVWPASLVLRAMAALAHLA